VREGRKQGICTVSCWVLGVGRMLKVGGGGGGDEGEESVRALPVAGEVAVEKEGGREERREGGREGGRGGRLEGGKELAT
jgi:hypothetical protein